MLGAWPTALCSTSASTSSNSNSNSIVAVSRLSSNSACSSSSPSASPAEKKAKKDLSKSSTEGSQIPSGIYVSRQKYIPVSKPVLLDALVGKMFSSEEHLADQFVRVSSCLDSILHAVHKDILEEMRADYLFTQSNGGEETTIPEDTGQTFDETDTDNHGKDSIELCAAGINGSENGIPSPKYLDMMNVFGSANNMFQRNSGAKSSVIEDASATRFQHSFMKLLRDAQFEELSARDLMLTSALNTDYLLTLPVYVDWEKASESSAIIFRRGYTTEKQRGLLVVNKLDYLQSKLIQAIFGFISKPLVQFGIWINEVIKSSGTMQEIQSWMTRVQLWTEESSRKSSFLFEKQTKLEAFDQHLDDDLPLGLASQRAVNLYEGLLSPEGPRSRLLRKFLSSIGLIKPTSVPPLELHDESSSEAFLRPVFLPRISLSDIWRPATGKHCGDNIWRMLRAGISIIFSQSVLQEPAFQELILLYTEETREKPNGGKAGIPSLQLKIYERIPIPDLPVIFPHKKLSFRILDTVRLDIATILGLLAYFINYKFEDVLSSPSAVLLDVVAASALILFLSRVALGYKQTWDRYQLLVNKTLYEKTLASGFGSVHFLLDASEQQQYKECILTYAVMLKAKEGQVICRQALAEQCERFLYDAFKEKVDMPIDTAVNTLMKFGLVKEKSNDGETVLHAVPCSVAYDLLKDHWRSLLS